jgi:hypothetical protein
MPFQPYYSTHQGKSSDELKQLLYQDARNLVELSYNLMEQVASYIVAASTEIPGSSIGQNKLPGEIQGDLSKIRYHVCLLEELYFLLLLGRLNNPSSLASEAKEEHPEIPSTS